MIDGRDVFTGAMLVIDKHGKDAGSVAAQRAEQMLEAGDLDGTMVGRQIVTAIEELQRGRRDGEGLN